MVVNNNVELSGNYASLESFRSGQQRRPVVRPAEQAPDKVEILQQQVDQLKEDLENTKQEQAEKPKKKRRGFVQGFKNMIAGIKKFGVATAEYTVATARGLAYGAVGAIGVLGADAVYNGIKAVKAPQAVEEGAKSALKLLSTKGKVAAGVVGLATLGYHWFKASLNVSQRNAAIDHRWGSGHDEVNN